MDCAETPQQILRFFGQLQRLAALVIAIRFAETAAPAEFVLDHCRREARPGASSSRPEPIPCYFDCQLLTSSS